MALERPDTLIKGYDDDDDDDEVTEDENCFE